jgi:hypothetical protein
VPSTSNDNGDKPKQTHSNNDQQNKRIFQFGKSNNTGSQLNKKSVEPNRLNLTQNSLSDGKFLVFFNYSITFDYSI